jgi:transposase
MPAALSADLRARVVAALDQGLSCAQAAARFGVSAASASRWRARAHHTGSVTARPVTARPMGGDRRSARLEEHAPFLLDQVAAQPDLTLAELQAGLRRRGVSAALGTIWRLLERHDLTYKKRRLMPRSSSART